MMDKAKAYDEALERARKQRDEYQKELDKTDKNSQLADILRAGISAVEMIFPQLIESEDEKFRKYILQCCKECIEADDKGLELSMSTTKKLLAYLEKQKDPKVDIDKLRRDLYQSGYNDGYQHGKEDAQKEQKPLKVGENAYFDPNTEMWFIKEEQKPAEWSDDIIRKAVKEVGLTQHQINWFKTNVFPPKQEWSEEDEEIIYSLRSFLIQAEQSGRYGSIQIAQIERCLNWLKSLHPSWKPSKKHRPAESISDLIIQGKGVYKICPRCKERMVRDDSMVYTSMPPQYRYECPKCGESECDTVMYDNPEMEEQKSIKWRHYIWTINLRFDFTALIKYDNTDNYEIVQAGNRPKQEKNGVYILIKDIKPQYSWKPSKEQMDALKNIAYGAYQNGDGPALRELYEQLLKLGVKEEPEYYQHFDPDC